MKIATVIFMYHPFYGGAEKQAHLLATTWQRSGHHVTILTMHFGQTPQKEILDGIPIVRVPDRIVVRGKRHRVVRTMIAAFFELRSMGGVDVVHINSAPFLLVPVLAFKKVYGTPVVLKMISGGVAAESTILMTSRWPWLNWFKRRLLNNVDAFVCLNDELEAEVKSLVPVARCIRIPNGVDFEYWRRSESILSYKRALGLEAYKTAIFVGRLVAAKGVDVLLAVWQEVVRRTPQSRLFIVGDGPLEGDLRQQAATLGISDSVTFAGSKQDVREFLLAMDAFLLFSPNEGMSNALLEAMAAGVPVVCSDNPGTSAVIQTMVNGIKIKSGEILQAAMGVCRIFEEPAFAAALAKRAQSDVRSRFDIAVTAKQYEQLFASLKGPVIALPADPDSTYARR